MCAEELVHRRGHVFSAITTYSAMNAGERSVHTVWGLPASMEKCHERIGHRVIELSQQSLEAERTTATQEESNRIVDKASTYPDFFGRKGIYKPR
jgi:hypothetical protein